MTPTRAPFHLDYWLPDPRLEGLVSGYHYYAVDPGPESRHKDVFFPGWANIRVQIDGGPWFVRLGQQTFEVPGAALFGPTSRTGYSDAGAGAIVGAGLTPLGWYRMTRRKAAEFADRVAPLEELFGAMAAEMASLLSAASTTQIKTLFDDIFLDLMSEPRPDEGRVRRMHRYLMEPNQGDVAEMAGNLGLSHRTMNRLALAAFGFGPKLLVRRARFLRSLMALKDGAAEPWAARIESSYYDHSHFNRDAQEFLGMAPREFLRLPKPLNEASLQLRAKILGAPAQALHQPRLTEPASAPKGAAGRLPNGDSVRPLDP